MLISFEKMLRAFFILCLGLSGARAGEDELYLLKNIVTNEVHCVYHSPRGRPVGLAWAMPTTIYNSPAAIQRVEDLSINNVTQVFGPPYADLMSWEYSDSISKGYNSSLHLPPYLVDSWNDLAEVGMQSADSPRAYKTDIPQDRLMVSVLSKNSVNIWMNTARKKTLSILVTSSHSNGSFATLKLCGKKGRKSCRTLKETQSSKAGGYLNNGTEWAHFAFDVERLHGNTVAHVSLKDLKSGDVLLNFTIDKKELVQEILFSSPKVSPSYPGSYRKHQSFVYLHRGESPEAKMEMHLYANSPDRACVAFNYFLHNGFGNAFVAIKSATYKLKPTDGKWKQMKVRFNSGGQGHHELIFNLPKVNVAKYGYVFGVHEILPNCTYEEPLISYIKLNPRDDKQNSRKRITACQTISYEEELFASVQGNYTCGPKKRCSNSAKPLFGKFCNISCAPFSNRATCEDLVMCDNKGCKCLPGYHFNGTICRPYSPTHAKHFGKGEFKDSSTFVANRRIKLIILCAVLCTILCAAVALFFYELHRFTQKIFTLALAFLSIPSAEENPEEHDF